MSDKEEWVEPELPADVKNRKKASNWDGLGDDAPAATKKSGMGRTRKAKTRKAIDESDSEDEPPPVQKSRVKASKEKTTDIDGIPDIADIPDLDDAGGDDEEDDITTQVAAAPNVLSQRVQNLNDLNHAAMFQLPAAPDGIDLSVLTSTLCPPTKLQELDMRWDFDTLFTEVSSEMIREQEEENEGDEDEGDDESLAPTSEPPRPSAPPKPRRGGN
mmetsp:Transcript_27306/g.38624  ORF Transcript_27306/g.38624 Transcript_27306/m.38624 type:complete len:216 (-) Transcript_27306:278-925(-)|eukprot:CAMPEP_0175097578 /NCGR_PEP_ID=MMETSP0086_2-20121207/5364_1 /TAXON_ID=136419 /ORGANISM="Unknown Unknown, Strain D1" /LENGTH=215 /DNA_ID=CAMNT_0016371103 /DNA_START=27 /DNA_END=674 /DNA_ORIENTATION=-